MIKRKGACYTSRAPAKQRWGDFSGGKLSLYYRTASEANGKAKENDILYPLIAGGPFDYAQGDARQGTSNKNGPQMGVVNRENTPKE